MSVLLRIQDLHLAFGDNVLLDGAELTVHAGERIALVGRNGTGKSTLLRLLAAEMQPDSGEIVRRQNLRVTLMPQEVPTDWSGRVYEVAAAGLGARGELIARYHQLSLDAASDAKALRELERVQHEIDATQAWDAEREVSTVLTRLELDADADFASLSGGRKRRVALARALIGQPELLLLDEPTNHLDLESIEMLENRLLGFVGALMFITHDRAFLRRLATRIVEIDRGRLGDYPGDYARYLRDKQAELEAEARRDELADRKLAQEETWIRQGIKARRTRNEGRVRALQRLRKERADRRERMGEAGFRLQSTQASGKIVIEARDLGYSYGEQRIVDGLDLTILRGDKIGIIGPNGVGKTTLLRLLLGQLQPQQGSVRIGTQLEIAYFDQLRAQLDPSKNARDNVAGGSDQVLVNGQSKHVISYLQDFLFSPRRAMEPITALSGGERNRLLLACLFTRPANLLVLDEPTNDLDVETLELLESLLVEYQGTLLVVSHDREFLDNVVTSSLVFEGAGKIGEYVGGYNDWLRQKPATAEPTPTAHGKRPAPAPTPATARPVKLSYKLQRELDALPAQIETLEQQQARLHAQAADPAVYRQGGDAAASLGTEINRVESELEAAYARWEELEAMTH